MSQTRSVDVELGGHKLALRSDADDKHLSALAEIVNERYAAVRAGSSSATPTKAALLTALSLADELLDAKRQHGQLKDAVRQRGKAVLEFLDRCAQESP